MAQQPYIYTKEKNWDYRQPAIYFVTFNVRDRRPILGTLVGGITDAQVEPTRLGQFVQEAMWQIAHHCSDIKTLSVQLMPDHLHAIVQVKRELPQTLGMYIRGFKASCNQEYWVSEMGTSQRDDSTTDKLSTPSDVSIRSNRKRCSGGLFEESFFPRRLTGRGQLQAMFDYMRDNPRRLAVKQSAGELFRLHREMPIAGYAMDAVGNLALLEQPMMAVHVRHNWTSEEKRAFKNRCIAEARRGTVLISPFISDDERAVRDEALREGLRIIVICDHGFGEMYKPEKMYFDACAEGRILMLSPWTYKQRYQEVTRAQCVAMNEMAEKIAGQT